MFNVWCPENTIKALTLMDLIAPQFRDFVLKRITVYKSWKTRKIEIEFCLLVKLLPLLDPVTKTIHGPHYGLNVKEI